MTATTITTGPRVATRMTLTGRVQGIGLRPAIARFAQQLSLAGYVRNTHQGVEIHVEGSANEVRRFEQELPDHFPASAAITTSQSRAVEPMESDTFVVRHGSDLLSDHAGRSGSPAGSSLSACVPTDVVTCEDCLAEVRNTTHRRHKYAFTSCTDCGPRYSIIERMPYERELTSMTAFPLCKGCHDEDVTPTDRRFHAQTNACPRCGPHIWLRDADDRVVARQDDALDAAAAAILRGRIVAVRGLGGYQLLVDATSQEAVERLRQRKRRFGKPLAVMVVSLDKAAKFAHLDNTERQILRHPAGPIVVALARKNARLANSMRAGLNTIGLMLPTTPLHWLLLNTLQLPLICTSGNLEGEPLVCEAEAARNQLQGIADVWLEHDRPIHRPIDDSVVRVMAGRPVTIRLARGYAPRPLSLESVPSFIALGGHQKASIALSNGSQAILGPHIGDLDTVATRQRFIEQLNSLAELYGTDNSRLISDCHPQYFTTEWAENHSHSVVQVQHHHAHVAAGMLEHGWLDRQVLGVALDGTGYGVDGTIWGGEFLLATATGFQRIGHLRPFLLPGGELAVRQPWRVATALVREAAGDEEAAKLAFQTGDPRSLLTVLQRPHLSPVTTSAGRLFDAMASLILNIEQCEYEGQTAMFLEAVCDRSATGHYSIPIQPTLPKQLDWRLLIRQVLRDRATGVPPGTMAMRFHRGLAGAVFEICRSYSSLPVVLGGGVFQNRVLVELLAEQFSDTRQPLGLPGQIPPNDGGLAAGQLAVAVAMDRQRSTGSCV